MLRRRCSSSGWPPSLCWKNWTESKWNTASSSSRYDDYVTKIFSMNNGGEYHLMAYWISSCCIWRSRGVDWIQKRDYGQMDIRPPPSSYVLLKSGAQIAERLSAHFLFSTVSLRILYQIRESFEESCRNSLTLFHVFSGKKEKNEKKKCSFKTFGGIRYHCRDPPVLLVFRFNITSDRRIENE